jgi:hypothetical protein
MDVKILSITKIITDGSIKGESLDKKYRRCIHFHGWVKENEKKKKETLWPCRQVQLGNGQIIMIVNQIDGTKRPAFLIS